MSVTKGVGGMYIRVEKKVASRVTEFMNGSFGSKGAIIRLLALKGHDLFYGAKPWEDLQQQDTICIT